MKRSTASHPTESRWLVESRSELSGGKGASEPRAN
jgi:hypothetical protein